MAYYKRFVIVLSLLLLAGFTAGAGERMVAEWMEGLKPDRDSTWVRRHISSDVNGKGTVTFMGADPVFCYSGSGSIAVANVRAGDFFEFTMPVDVLKKGTEVDFHTFIGVTSDKGPSSWTCELFDGRRWVCDSHSSFRTGHGVGFNESTFFHTFTLKRKLVGALKVRLRVVECGSDSSATVYFMGYPRTSVYLGVCDVPVMDTRRVLAIGNSFTFFHGAHIALKEIAHSQGHKLDLTSKVKGGASFGKHLALVFSRLAVVEGRYQDVILQNQSYAHSSYASDPGSNAYILADAVELAGEIRRFSPDCRLILERTWAYPSGDWKGYGSAEEFDSKLQEGTETIAKAIGAEVSPIGTAFMIARGKGMDVYYRDGCHPSRIGSYLKACVNYLLLYSSPFDDAVTDYGLDPAIAAQCREIASQVVLR